MTNSAERSLYQTSEIQDGLSAPQSSKESDGFYKTQAEKESADSFVKLPLEKYNLIVLLGPTAVGKTALGVRLADKFGGEIISADSRQVYKELNLGSGKDICEYTLPDGKKIPYHLIDITDLSYEYNVFDYQCDFYKTFVQISERGKIPFLVGGTGMYIDSVVRNYDLVPVPKNPSLREELEKKTLEELGAILLKMCPDFHTSSHLKDRERVIRHIEIKTFMNGNDLIEFRKTQPPKPEIRPFIIGTTLLRPVLRENIERRLQERFKAGMLDEVFDLHKKGVSWQRLESLGLEYKFISEFLEGKYDKEESMYEALNRAIAQFAKRQETWFRGMEKKGIRINWLPSVPDAKVKFTSAVDMILGAFL
ncbi:tRNA (adenosine(37)-N6)-dimethylallyltransferase MiaA [Treponema parvum]|uniref:tRNA dimethylallyltransferase n=1 Tax=Treponema parvum TaxID=138851 RepID=A0A975F3F8_9SPIR|nr:tRNA (adenosine(37)-N6)-dimethylallyltransferase MiaA [Treponema parvum]QTQ13628.1 tRNA (adenosine(37)-N6)-dimethylallyltransferase MiaA [Treponema parvum]